VLDRLGGTAARRWGCGAGQLPFDAAATPDLAECGLANHDLLDAVRRAGFTVDATRAGWWTTATWAPRRSAASTSRCWSCTRR